MMVSAIEDDETALMLPHQRVGQVFGHSGNARNAIDNFKLRKPTVAISVQTGLGLTGREVEEAVVGRAFRVMAEDGVQAAAYYDGDANEIVVHPDGKSALRCHPLWKRQPTRRRRGHQALG